MKVKMPYPLTVDEEPGDRLGWEVYFAGPAAGTHLRTIETADKDEADVRARRLEILNALTGSTLDPKAFTRESHLLLGLEPEAIKLITAIREMIGAGALKNYVTPVKPDHNVASEWVPWDEWNRWDEDSLFDLMRTRVDQSLEQQGKSQLPFEMLTLVRQAKALYGRIKDGQGTCERTLRERIKQIGLPVRLQVVEGLQFDLPKEWDQLVPTLTEDILSRLQTPPADFSDKNFIASCEGDSVSDAFDSTESTRTSGKIVCTLDPKARQGWFSRLGWQKPNVWKQPCQEVQLPLAKEMIERILRGVFQGQGFHVLTGPSRIGKTVLTDRIMFKVYEILHRYLGGDVDIYRISGAQQLTGLLSYLEQCRTKLPSHKDLPVPPPALVFAHDIGEPSRDKRDFGFTKILARGGKPSFFPGWGFEQHENMITLGGKKPTDILFCDSRAKVEEKCLPAILNAWAAIQKEGTPVTVIATENAIPNALRRVVTVHDVPGESWVKGKRDIFPDRK
ncbi:MAG: hypothetical protein V1760_02585 [Candidatus Peregrinibacteria bacterium]